MNKEQICSQISRQHGIDLQDTEVLYSICANGDACEISFPANMSQADRRKFLLAHEALQELISQEDDVAMDKMEAKSIFVPKSAQDIGQFVSHFQQVLGNKFVVSEVGAYINHVDKPTTEELEAAISSICLTGNQFERAHCMLQWALADLTSALCRESGERKRTIHLVSIAFHINEENLRRLVNMSIMVPRHKRIPGWTWRHYQQLFKYVPSMDYHEINKACSRLSKGRSVQYHLSNGATVQSQTPLTYRQVDQEMARITGKVKLPKRKHVGKRYLYIVNGRSFFSDDLDEGALADPAIQVIDCALSSQVRGPNRERQLLPEFDPENTGSFSTPLGLRPYTG